MQLLKYFIFIILFLYPTISFSQTGFAKYTEEVKMISQMEWRLLNINVDLTTKEAKVSYNSNSNQFECIVWVLTTDAKTPTRTLRGLLLSTTNFTVVLLNNYFSDFNKREDLIVNFKLGASGYGDIAIFKNGTFRFTDIYYQYLRETSVRN